MEELSKQWRNFQPPEDLVAQRIAHFAHVTAGAGNKEGDAEVPHDVTFTHHFVDAPGDAETALWHYVECGPSTAKQ